MNRTEHQSHLLELIRALKAELDRVPTFDEIVARLKIQPREGQDRIREILDSDEFQDISESIQRRAMEVVRTAEASGWKMRPFTFQNRYSRTVLVRGTSPAGIDYRQELAEADLVSGLRSFYDRN